MKMKEKLIVIGNGMAGMRTVEEILKIDAEMYEISVFGDEPYGNYNRIIAGWIRDEEGGYSVGG